MSKKPWSGRFQEATNKAVEAFTVSVSYDKRLYSYDIQGSMAHCRMLAKVGLMSQEESQQILSGLQEIKTEIETGRWITERIICCQILSESPKHTSPRVNNCQRLDRVVDLDSPRHRHYGVYQIGEV